MALIREVTAGKTLVMVEHDMSVVFGLADRISVRGLRRGDRHRHAGGDPRQRRGCKEAYLGTQARAAGMSGR
ncbi:MAG: hypothetical protein MZW92_48655 [Comamonadaceae bacterium]|nr:hypothetical protein [Comamonadaceae bacterium]